MTGHLTTTFASSNSPLLTKVPLFTPTNQQGSIETAEGLVKAHQPGFVQRDMKPDN